jgi:rfaE bifunctional protein kinase chain/domain
MGNDSGEIYMNITGKILSLEDLAQSIGKRKEAGERIVLCHGVFDLIHIGHIRHFEQARRKGDVLVVTLTPDRYVNKGVNRPAFPEKLRAEAIAALGMVDFVGINQWPTAIETLRLLHPNVYCKGSEYRKNQVDAQSHMLPEVIEAENLGIAMEYTEDITYSSSTLINRYFSTFAPETDEWLHRFRKEHSAKEITDSLEALRSLKVLVIGESIIDEYIYCQAMGKSTKDPVLACRYKETESIAGGSLAVANHVAGFCDQVRLVTCLGDRERREDFVRSALLPNVEPVLLTKSDSPTIHKRRIVDSYTQNKLLELYVMEDRPLCGGDEIALNSVVGEGLENWDVVIAIDFGHGLFTASLIETLCARARFLAVNAQSNAGNHGFNPISKYRRADYICLASHEINIETRMREGDPYERVIEVAERVDCPRFTVTLGSEGSTHYEKGKGFIDVPAFATQVTDRVGAGDSVLALTSLLVAQGAPWDITGFIGNVAGAEIVSVLGNRVPIGLVPLSKHIIALLK